MKKTVLFLSLLCTVNITTAQNLSGEVTYKKESLRYLSEDEDWLKKNEKDPVYIKTLIEMDKNTKLILEDLRFKLTFTKNESIFKADEFLELEKNRFFWAAIGPDGSNIYYTNIKNDENLRQVDAYGELFLVKSPKIDWMLTTETKKIGNYQCYKATAIEVTQGAKGAINSEVVAWYAPELNIAFGPLGFSGLPGLIVELEYRNLRYTASKIDLKADSKNAIKKPTAGMVVTKEEFDQIGNKTMKSLKNGF
ncbi:MAG: GLPGLI family protein [Bacteroidetes bacterium]|nr:GLPGLI family protein [Bacteroidota bacterium]